MMQLLFCIGKRKNPLEKLIAELYQKGEGFGPKEGAHGSFFLSGVRFLFFRLEY